MLLLNNMNITKVFGWGLLFLGLIIIIATLYLSFAYFTGKSKSPELFSMPENASPETKVNISDPQKMIEKTVQDQIKSIIPDAFINQTFNLIAWTLFALILIFGGSRISFTGIKIIK